MKMLKIAGTVATIATFTFTNLQAEEHVVSQKNKRFSQSEITIKVGDSISFPNHDPFFHSVFSLSETKTFDLGSYKNGATKVETFDTAGVVEAECALHPRMQLKITVEE